MKATYRIVPTIFDDLLRIDKYYSLFFGLFHWWYQYYMLPNKIQFYKNRKEAIDAINEHHKGKNYIIYQYLIEK